MTARTGHERHQVLWVLEDGAGFGPGSDLHTTRALIVAGLAERRVAQHLTTLGRISTADGTPAVACIPVDRQGLDVHPLSFSGAVRRTLATFDAVFIRVDPPITQRFRHALIQLAMEEHRVWFINSPSAILARGSKLFNQRVHDWLAPGLVAADPDLLLKEMQAWPGAEFVAKPLDLAGGRDVVRLRAGDPAAAPLLRTLTHSHGFIHLQRFVPAVEADGEIRHLVFNGRILAAWRKRPAPGDYRANLDQGATVERLPPEADLALAKAVARRVSAIAPGFVFYSIDTIGPYVNELNVENTGGLPNADALYGRDHARLIIELMCAELQRRRAAGRAVPPVEARSC